MKRSTLKPSRGTVWPLDVARQIEARDKRCVGPLIGMPGDCVGQLEKDHIRSSGGLGMKSPSTVENGVLLCNGTHHPLKTREGRTWRPVLIEYVEFMASRLNHDAHVDPCGPDCRSAVPV